MQAQVALDEEGEEPPELEWQLEVAPDAQLMVNEAMYEVVVVEAGLPCLALLLTKVLRMNYEYKYGWLM